MICDKCKCSIPQGEEVKNGGRTLCEDCLMDAMSPAKACDPWAVKLAKGNTPTGGEKELVGVEKALFELIKEKGRIRKEEAAALLGVSQPAAERAFATLRHMELMRAERRDDGGADLVPFK